MATIDNLDSSTTWMELKFDETVPRSVRFHKLDEIETFCQSSDINPVDKIMALDYYYHRVCIRWRSDQPKFKNLYHRIVNDFLFFRSETPENSQLDRSNQKNIYQIFSTVDRNVLEDYIRYYLDEVRFCTPPESADEDYSVEDGGVEDGGVEDRDVN